MRTFSAEAQAAMDSGQFEPYIRVGLCDAEPNNVVEWIQPISYKISDFEAEATLPIEGTDYSDGGYFCFRRGVILNGTPETTTTSSFFTTSVIKDEKFYYLKGHLLPHFRQNVGLNLTWKQVIEAIVRESTLYWIKPTYEFPAHAVWNYQFYPTGRNVIFNNLQNLTTIFKQKYLVFIRHTENTFDVSATKIDIYFYQPTETRATDYTITDLLFTCAVVNSNFSTLSRQFLWRDDDNSVHTYTPPSASFNPVIHNLGYIPTAGNRPAYADSYILVPGSSKLPPNLKYESGDKVAIVHNTGTLTCRVTVTEYFQAGKSPTWYNIITPMVWFNNTEGGAMPSTIEAATPYTPLNTSYFNAILSTSDNNIQAAMETLDDHTHDYSELTGTPSSGSLNIIINQTFV